MFWACAVIGAACVPLNAWWKAEELEFAPRRLGRAGCSSATAKRWEVVRDVVGALDALEHVFVIGLDATDGPARPGTELLAPEDPGALPDVAVARGRPARDPLHLGHHRQAEGCDDHAPPGAREPAEPRVPGRDRRRAGRGDRRGPSCRPRTCSWCRSSTSPARSRPWSPATRRARSSCSCRRASSTPTRRWRSSSASR